nr:unnamed protein product [Callosobruchus analis]
MERFNNDKRIFAFILSTRSGGVGVNLTGADTVIFYDSDWNPTMDAQAQDRCHRIGQTRDVHIYRLVSERTIEENILKKANQKRLLGDLAIEGGNFTTAYFKSSTIQDLFNVDQSEEATATSRLAELVDAKEEQEKLPQTAAVATTSSSTDEKTAVGALESALAACEDDQDVQAARTAKAEAVADLAEFDEDIPLEEQQQQEPAQQQQKEVSKAEQEINSVIEKLSPIEKYAMKFIEATESAWSAEQLAAAEREIEEQKRVWEKNRLAAMREEEERRARELEEESDIITYSREDAANQVSNIHKFRRFKFKARRRKIVKVNAVNNKLLNKVKMKRRRKRRRLKQTETHDAPPPQLNGDTENSLDSSESLSNSIINNRNSNHVDHNSPRTRSRGTVAINLWTLDVSPILPGEKPMKRNMKERTTSLSEDCQSGSEEKAERKKCSKRRACSVSGDDSQSGGEEKVVVVKRKRGRPRNEDKGKPSDSGICEVKKCTVILNDILADGQVHISSEHEAKYDDDKSVCRSDTDVDDNEDVDKNDPCNETNMDCNDQIVGSKEKQNSDANSAEATNLNEHVETADSINTGEPIQIQSETQSDEIAEKLTDDVWDSKQSPLHNDDVNLDTKSDHLDETMKDFTHTGLTNVENHSKVDGAKETIIATDTNEIHCDSDETHDEDEQQHNNQSDDEKEMITDDQTSACQENETIIANDILAELGSEIEKLENSSKIVPNCTETVVDIEAAPANSDEAAKETTQTALDGNVEIDNTCCAVSLNPTDTNSDPVQDICVNSVVENSENFPEPASHNHASDVEGLVNNTSISQICNSTDNTEEMLENEEIHISIPVNNDLTNANEPNQSRSGTLFLKHPNSNLKFRSTVRKPYRKLGNNNGKTLDGWIRKSPKDASHDFDDDTSNAD